MADTTISGAASLTASTVADGDLIPVLDISASAGSKASKITVAEMKARVLAVFPSDGHPYGFKDGAVVRLADSAIYVPIFATHVSSVAGWTVTGDTPILTGTNVTFANPGSVTAITATDGFNSFNAGATLDFTELTGLTSIGSYAFNFAINLVGSLVLPDSLTSIGQGAFDGCSGLTGTLTIPSSVTSIGSMAFYYCSGFTTVNAYVALSVIDVTNSLFGTSVTDIHARSSDGTWTAGAGQTIGSKTGITVTKDL